MEDIRDGSGVELSERDKREFEKCGRAFRSLKERIGGLKKWIGA